MRELCPSKLKIAYIPSSARRFSAAPDDITPLPVEYAYLLCEKSKDHPSLDHIAYGAQGKIIFRTELR